MDDFVDLLNKANVGFMTKEEHEEYLSRPEVMLEASIIMHAKMMIRKSNKQRSGYGEKSIGEIFAKPALWEWNTRQNETIERITQYIATGYDIEPRFIIGIISLWCNSKIQHPIVEELVKYSVQNGLMKLPLSTKVKEYNSITYKEPNHAPRLIQPSLWIETLMTYFEIKTILGTSIRLGIDRKCVKDHLSRIVNGEVEYKVLIDENFEHYELIQETYYRWLAYKKR